MIEELSDLIDRMDDCMWDFENDEVSRRNWVFLLGEDEISLIRQVLTRIERDDLNGWFENFDTDDTGFLEVDPYYTSKYLSALLEVIKEIGDE